MKFFHIQSFFVVAIALIVAGCSANKTGSNFNLARVNPFQWIKPESETKPYPQKPSSFTSPTDPSARYPETLASSTKAGALPATPSSQAYPGAQARYESVESTAYPSTTTSTAGQPFGGTPRSYPSASTQSSNTLPTTSPVKTTTWQASPAGVASAIDDLSSTQSGVSNDSRPESAVYPAADSSGGASALSESAAISGGARAPSGQYQYQAAPQAATAATQDASARGTTDWSTLVGDRYARLYQNGNSKSATVTNGNLGDTGYTPGNTGYVPGRLDNPPGNVNYQPGQTGYTPPGVPPYVMPYGSSGQQSSVSSTTQANSGTATSANEYRPGSTKTYIPRTASPSSTSFAPGSGNLTPTASLPPY